MNLERIQYVWSGNTYVSGAYVKHHDLQALCVTSCDKIEQ